MSYIEKEKLIKADIASIENRVRHAFNQGYDLGYKEGKERAKTLSPTTKNDLGVECVDRERLKQIVFNITAEYDTETIHIDRLIDEIDNLPTVTPIRPKGHWIDADGDNAICGCCNRLNHLYGTYCKHCGAEMSEVEE